MAGNQKAAEVPKLSQKQALENKYCRQAAEALIDAAKDDTRPRFWEEVVRLATMKAGITTPQKSDGLAPMTEREALLFEAEEVPFGHYKGQLLYKVPTDYLDFIAHSGFARMCRRYLLSDRYKRRLLTEERSE